jgi:hypothetical protein
VRGVAQAPIFAMNDHTRSAGSTNSLRTPDGRRKIVILAIISGTIAFLSFFIPLNSQESTQQRNMRAAKHHIDLIVPRIHADARFRNIELQPYTGEGGCLGVFGEVANAADRADLERIITESKPPVKVFFVVLNDEELEQLKQKSK